MKRAPIVRSPLLEQLALEGAERLIRCPDHSATRLVHTAERTLCALCGRLWSPAGELLYTPPVDPTLNERTKAIVDNPPHAGEFEREVSEAFRTWVKERCA